MRSSVIFVGLAVLASTNAAVLQARDACSNGIKVCLRHIMRTYSNVAMRRINADEYRYVAVDRCHAQMEHVALATVTANVVQYPVNDVQTQRDSR